MEFRFCRAKCRRAFTKKKAPRKTKWTKTYRKSFQKDLSDDFAQTFERKRNELQKYSRENLLTTLQAIEKINKIKEKREKHHILKRLQKGVELRKKEDVKLVETQMHLIKASHSRALEPELDEVTKVQEPTVEKMDVEMENLEARMEQETAPTTSKTVIKRKKLLAKA